MARRIAILTLGALLLAACASTKEAATKADPLAGACVLKRDVIVKTGCAGLG
jgi:PBP1b-binding outer membrane lipoprotein LpoB